MSSEITLSELSPVIIISALIVFPIIIILAGLYIQSLQKKHIQEIKQKFYEKFHVAIPPEFYMQELTCSTKKYYFKLGFPHWRYAKKDGTADKRASGNYIVWEKSFLYIDNLCLSVHRPDSMIRFVHLLRDQEVRIVKHNIEKKKTLFLQEKNNMYFTAPDVNSIISRYRDNPTGFEEYCAELFRKMGYAARVTPPTNDGGYDILVSKENIVGIVECKCYSSSSIGRPAIQKLMGANSVIHADEMYFITTSYFSKPAIDYARQMGITLIDGTELIRLVQEKNTSSENSVKVRRCDWELTISDLLNCIPTDIFEKFFKK